MLATSGERVMTGMDCMRRGGPRLGAAVLSIVLAGATAAVIGCARKPAIPSRTPRPNVLLIVLDALRADRLHCYGCAQETSPTLDRLASEGVLFSDDMAQGAETVNSVPLLLAGRRPGDRGMVWREVGGLKYAVPGPGSQTLAELLRKQGYATGLISENPVLGTEPAVTRGFDTVEAPLNGAAIWVQASGDELNQQTFAWLGSRARAGKPFFLYLHYLDPHGEYRPPPEFCVLGRPGYTAHDDKINQAMTELPEGELAPGTTAKLLSSGGLTRADVARLSDLYDDEVLYGDHCVGQLFSKLKALGLYDNTLIVVTADHGEAFLEHDDAKHRASLYQELVHVPLIVKGPGIGGDRSMDQLVESVDIAPTILEAAGGGASTGMSGHSLYGALAHGTKLADEIAMAEIPLAKSYALRDGKLKLIVSPGRVQLYDLSQDPGETRDLRSARPEEVDRLTKLLGRLLSQRSESTTKAEPLTARQREVLKSLGYIK
jgi:arylsulfatase